MGGKERGRKEEGTKWGKWNEMWRQQRKGKIQRKEESEIQIDSK